MTVSHMVAWGAAVTATLVWLSLLLLRGFFWRLSDREEIDVPNLPPGRKWPSVVVVIPARDEAAVIGRCVSALVTQEYPGAYRIVLVDDQSSDGTAEVALRAARNAGENAAALEIVPGTPPPPGWTGKLWSLHQGLARAESDPGGAPVYYLLTDADIVHTRDHLSRLVIRAEQRGLVLVSTMVRLHCVSFWERFLMPAFVFFFQMLYPFAWVNGSGRTAAAAGGCMLVRRSALAAAGGLAAISDTIIDDCALAARMKRVGRIWLGLTDHARSIRPYAGMGEIRAMIARSAYAQLRYSPFLLIAAVLFMFVAYVAPTVLALAASGVPQGLGLCAWMAMAVAMAPMLRYYHQSPLWGLALPVIAGFYIAFTLDSAFQYTQGRGGMWKGRLQAR